MSLYFISNSKLGLIGFTGLDRGACPTTKRSIIGFNFFLCDNLIYQKIKKQLIVCRSFSKAQYRVLANTAYEAKWLLYILGISHHQPIIISFDNKSAIHIAINIVFHKCTEHIEMDCHLVRDKIQSKKIHLIPFNSKNQVADLFMKPRHLRLLSYFISKLGMLNIHSILKGGVKT